MNAQALAEEWAEREREREIVESLTQERPKPYYLGHPDVTQKAHRALTEAEKRITPAKDRRFCLVRVRQIPDVLWGRLTVAGVFATLHEQGRPCRRQWSTLEG